MHEVSVVIPLYNKAREIGRCLQSVEEQTRPPLELLVIDDGSTDDGAAAVNSQQDPRIRLITQTNQGTAAARNRGIDEAKGDRVAFLDADDEWKPEFLETVDGLSQRFPDAGIWATAYAELAEANGAPVQHRFAGLPSDPAGGLLDDFFASMYRFPPVCSINAMFPRHVFEKVGRFPVGQTLAEDWDMWTRIALHYPVAYHPRVAAIYHTHAENRATQNRAFDGQDTALLRSLQSALNADVFPYTSRASVKRFTAKHLLEIAKHRLAAGDRSGARQRIQQAWALGVLPGKCLRWWLRSLV